MQNTGKMQGTTGEHWQKGGKRNKYLFLTEHTKKVLTFNKNMHLMLHSSTKALVIMSIFIAPKRG